MTKTKPTSPGRKLRQTPEGHEVEVIGGPARGREGGRIRWYTVRSTTRKEIWTDGSTIRDCLKAIDRTIADIERVHGRKQNR